MKILRNDANQNIIFNTETDFQTNLGWQENMLQFEDEVLSTIINPSENYETVRFIHKPYTSSNGIEQTDIWFYFYFLTGTTYVTDYNAVGIETKDNAKMLKHTTESFFRLEFFKTPKSGTTYESPSRVNRKLVFAKNLSLPLGEKYFYNGNNINEFVHFPVFMGSNYKNKENMYFFWFQDESVLSESILSGDTFWMTAKFFNAEDGSIVDFVNDVYSTSREVVETTDMYFKVVIDRSDYSYKMYKYTGGTTTESDRVGKSETPIKFYERGGGSMAPSTPTPTPTITQTVTPTPSVTPGYIAPTSSPTPTPTVTPTPPAESLPYTYYLATPVTGCSVYCASPGFSTGTEIKSATSSIASLIYTYVYDSSGNPFAGAGSNYIYAASTTIGYNTYDENGGFVLTIENDGLVTNVAYMSCNAGNCLDDF